jgi:mRNA interferase RelE/StbE
MSWNINYLKDAHIFITQNNIEKQIKEEIIKLIKFLNGEKTNIDIKKLKGNWAGYYRIRKGKIRIILLLNKISNTITIDKIDYRGDVYK